MENQTYDVAKAIEAQKEYCKEYAAKHPEDWMHDRMSKGQGFAPMSGVCYCCHQQMYAETGQQMSYHSRLRRYLPDGKINNGISVERARKELTTGCPFCYHSFVE